MKIVSVIFGILLSSIPIFAQDGTYRLNVLSYQWTTSHKPVNFTWQGHSNTSCNGNSNVTGYVSGSGSFSANGTSSGSCSTTFTPPSTQTIDIQKPVVFILAETDSSRMVLSCTRNVLWSQCEALNPGTFLARTDKGHFEVEASNGKGKEEWVKFEIVQQSAIQRTVVQPIPQTDAKVSILPPTSAADNSNPGFSTRWKSMTSGNLRTLRFTGDYIYGEVVISEAATKAGMFSLMEVQKSGEIYKGTSNIRQVRQDGVACSYKEDVELTLVTPARIEGRGMSPPDNAKLDWTSCTYSPSPTWKEFAWIPVQ